VTSVESLRSSVSAAAGKAVVEARSSFLRRTIQVQPRSDLLVLGDLSYGGYRVPVDGLDTDSVVYSVGVGEDIRFDLALIARFGCTVYSMDPVPRSAEYARAAAAHEPRFVYHQLALWSRDETLTFYAPREEGYISHSATNLFGTAEAFQAEGRSLRSLMRSWDHDHIDLLKISAEGSEFTILDTLLRDERTSTKIDRGGWTFTWLHGRP
jgi:FkbM family methyltransferase